MAKEISDKIYSCCFTGHRTIPSEKLISLNDILTKETEKLILNGIKYFYCGGAVGFDTLAARVVLELKKIYDIQLIIVVPNMGQDKYFTEKQKKEYNQILHHADTVIYLSDHYYKGCMQKRNQYMVEGSTYCICYLVGKTGGTAYTVNYARKHHLNIINTANFL
ncbi:MAG TPA: DUF1273 family protein [Candidatus Coprocola pullicola]|nr:DUF1273 family protein [Candidatus Coprocola pullicola]